MFVVDVDRTLLSIDAHTKMFAPSRTRVSGPIIATVWADYNTPYGVKRLYHWSNPLVVLPNPLEWCIVFGVAATAKAVAAESTIACV